MTQWEKAAVGEILIAFGSPRGLSSCYYDMTTDTYIISRGWYGHISIKGDAVRMMQKKLKGASNG